MAGCDTLFPLFLLAVTAAIFIVAIPAEHADKGKANTNGQPGHTKVKSAKLIKHVSHPRENRKNSQQVINYKMQIVRSMPSQKCKQGLLA